MGRSFVGPGVVELCTYCQVVEWGRPQLAVKREGIVFGLPSGFVTLGVGDVWNFDGVL